MLAMKLDTSDLDRKLALMMEMPRMIEKAVVGAMSETVNDIHAAQIQEMKLSFDRPTLWLQKGLVKSLPYGKDAQYGNKRLGQSLARSGTYFEEFPTGRSPNDVVRPHVYGGSRPRKANEKRLASIGALPQGGFAIMGREYPKNIYGNIPGSVYSRMLADLGAIPTAQASKKRQGKAAQFFVMTAEGSSVPTHIAERVGNNLRTVLAFAQSVNYKERYNFHKVGKDQLAYSLPRHFDRILNRYMSRL
jgi:hypothetical protein